MQSMNTHLMSTRHFKRSSLDRVNKSVHAIFRKLNFKGEHDGVIAFGFTKFSDEIADLLAMVLDIMKFRGHNKL